MIVRLASLLLIAALLLAPAPGAAEEFSMTQRQWVINLVESLGWSFGLPDEPEDADYLALLEGNRTYRIEAETHHRQEDMVSVKSYNTFGPFSGSGWLSGISTSTTAHLPFLLPHGGTYGVRIAVRLPGHQVRLGGRQFRADGEQAFTTVELGELKLPAGPLEIEIELPPGGAVDFIELSAPALPLIAPPEGWQLDAPLTADLVARSVAQLLGLELLLPERSDSDRREAEDGRITGNVEITTVRHLGVPSAERWVRAGTASAQVEIDLNARADGVYALIVRGTATSPLKGDIDGGHPFAFDLPASLEDTPVTAAWLAKGTHTLTLQLPPRAGVDVVTLKALDAREANYRNLVGLDAEQPLSPELANRLLSLLALLGAAE